MLDHKINADILSLILVDLNGQFSQWRFKAITVHFSKIFKVIMMDTFLQKISTSYSMAERHRKPIILRCHLSELLLYFDLYISKHSPFKMQFLFWFLFFLFFTVDIVPDSSCVVFTLHQANGREAHFSNLFFWYHPNQMLMLKKTPRCYITQQVHMHTHTQIFRHCVKEPLK